MKKLIPLVAFVLIVCQGSAAQDLNTLFSEAMSAYQNEEYKQALGIFEKMDSIRSNHPVINKNLARLYARTGRISKAETYLKKIAITDADTALFDVKDFDSFKKTDRYAPLRALFIEMQQPVHTSELAFETEDKTLHPESVAYDSQTKQFFLSSIRHRKIVVRSAGGGITDFATEGQDGLWAVLGMKIDKERRVLWVCTAALPQMVGYDTQMEGQTGIFQYHIDSGKLIAKYILEEEGNHTFGDLAIAHDGTVYITDSVTAAIYSIRDDKLIKIKALPEFRSLQGITLNADKLYFADYIAGIYSLDLVNPGEAPKLINTPQLVSAKGIDGLYWYKNGLVTIQNGVRPMRITYLKLDDTRSEVVGHIYLEKATNILDEPTLGTLAGNRFYYVANSPWGYYGKDQQLKTAEINKPAIYRISLDEVK